MVKMSSIIQGKVTKHGKSPADQEMDETMLLNGTIINSPFVSVREYASDTAPVVDYVQEGEKVTILGRASTFYMVRYGRLGRLGFVSRHYVRGCYDGVN